MTVQTTDRIPLVDLKAQYLTIKPDIDAAIQATVSETAFIMGSRVTELESRFAAMCGATHGIGVSSATTGLHLILHALGVGAGDEVIVPAHTFIATAEAVCHCGATPVFVDVSPNAYTMNPSAFESAITDRTRAVIPVHLYGQCADMKRINEIAHERKIAVIEDAAQAHGSHCAHGNAGNMGTAAVFSFYPGKNLGAFGDGGMITTSDPAFYKRLHMLANHGRTTKYLHEMIGFNYRLDALQAAVVAVKLRHLAKWNERRRILAKRYNEAFQTFSCFVPEFNEGHVFHLYVLQVHARDRLMEDLDAHGIDAGIHYPVPCHSQPCFRYLPTVSLPVTEQLVKRIVTLPLYPELSFEQQDRVIEAVTTHCHRHPLDSTD